MLVNPPGTPDFQPFGIAALLLVLGTMLVAERLTSRRVGVLPHAAGEGSGYPGTPGS
jgi:hypothetical protein